MRVRELPRRSAAQKGCRGGVGNEAHVPCSMADDVFKTGVVSHRRPQEGADTVTLLIGQHLCVGDPEGIVKREQRPFGAELEAFSAQSCHRDSRGSHLKAHESSRRCEPLRSCKKPSIRTSLPCNPRLAV